MNDNESASTLEQIRAQELATNLKQQSQIIAQQNTTNSLTGNTNIPIVNQSIPGITQGEDSNSIPLPDKQLPSGGGVPPYTANENGMSPTAAGFNSGVQKVNNAAMIVHEAVGSDRTIREMVGRATVSYSTKGFKEEENTVYENHMRTTKLMDNLSMVIGDFNQVDTMRNYNNIDNAYLQKIYGANNDMVLKNMSEATWTAKNINGQGGSKSANVDLKSLGAAQVEQIIRTGSFTKDGMKYNCADVDKYSPAAIAGAVLDNRNYNNTQSRITNAKSKNEKLAAMAEIKSQAMNYLSTTCNIPLKTGSALEIEKHLNVLEHKLRNETDSKVADEIRNSIKELQAFRDAGLTNVGNAGFGQGTRQTMSRASRAYLGNDMMAGITFYHNAGRAAARTVDLGMAAIAKLGQASLTGVALASAKINEDSQLSLRARETSNKIKKTRSDQKDRRTASRNGTRKAYNEKHSLEKNKQRAKKHEESVQISSTRIDTLKNKKGNSDRENERIARQINREQRKLRKLNASGNRRGAIAGAHERISNWWKNSRVGDAARRIGGIINVPSRLLTRFQGLLHPLRSIKNAIKRGIMRHIIVPFLVTIGGFIIQFVIFMAVPIVIIVSLYFISEICDGSITDALDNMNYVQYIVDCTAEDLGDEFITVAKSDAEIFWKAQADEWAEEYQESYKASHNGESDSNFVEVEVLDPEIKSFVATEDESVVVASVNANLCPITSMMHYRYYDDLDYESYTTAMAYEYFMYVFSHHVGSYSYEDNGDNTITPEITISIDMTYEKLAEIDTFKTTTWISDSDIRESVLNVGSKMTTITLWHDYWSLRALRWFVPIPSFSGIANHIGKSAIYDLASLVDTIKDSITSLFTGGTDGTDEEIGRDAMGDAYDDDDMYGFDGWWNDDETINQDIMDDLEDMYGSWDDEYEEGVELWGDFDVVFPVGVVYSLTDEQIEYILEEVEAANPNISDTHLAVIKEALEGVGQFWYSLTGTAHENGATNTSGASECSGFVSGVLTRALGTTYDMSAAEYASLANDSTAKAGDVIATNNGGSGYTGHVLIYVGYLTGVGTYESGNSKVSSGSGYYVIDCSSSIGGTSLRRLDNATTKYPYYYDYDK